MKTFIENFKGLLISVINVAGFILSLYSALIFFLVFFIYEKWKGEENSRLKEELIFLQQKVDRIPELLKEFLKLQPEEKADKVLEVS